MNTYSKVDTFKARFTGRRRLTKSTASVKVAVSLYSTNLYVSWSAYESGPLPHMAVLVSRRLTHPEIPPLAAGIRDEFTLGKKYKLVHICLLGQTG